MKGADWLLANSCKIGQHRKRITNQYNDGFLKNEIKYKTGKLIQVIAENEIYAKLEKKFEILLIDEEMRII